MDVAEDATTSSRKTRRRRTVTDGVGLHLASVNVLNKSNASCHSCPFRTHLSPHRNKWCSPPLGSGHRAGKSRCFHSISEEAAEKEEAFSEFGGLSCFRLPAPELLRGWRLFNPRHNGIGS